MSFLGRQNRERKRNVPDGRYPTEQIGKTDENLRLIKLPVTLTSTILRKRTVY